MRHTLKILLPFALPPTLSFHADTIPLKTLWISWESIYKTQSIKKITTTSVVELASTGAAERKHTEDS